MCCTPSALRLNYTATPYCTAYRQAFGGHRCHLRYKLKMLPSLLGMDPELYIRKILLDKYMLPYPVNALRFHGHERMIFKPSIVLTAKGQKGFQVKLMFHSTVRTQLRSTNFRGFRDRNFRTSELPNFLQE